MILRPEFVELIPDQPEEGVLYISILHTVAIHRCACGCGEEVITPLDPDRWSFTFDGKTVTLDPSIGNWNFPCRSHYFVRRNRIVWVNVWDDDYTSSGKRSKRKKSGWKRFFDW
ncbi:MAG: DUF6527 family protein [Chitinophagaceae bacterium]